MKRRLRAVILLAMVAFLAHAPALLGTVGGALPSTGDTLGAFYPWHEFVRHSLQQRGEIPLWNPHLLCGVPFLANGQSALLYPPTYLHFLLPEGIALWLFAWLHSTFYMVGGYFLARQLGMRRRAAFLAAALLGLGNATPAHLFGGHLTFLPTRAYWPWQAVFLLCVLRGQGMGNAVGLALCLGLGLAAGAPQIWLFGVAFCAALFLAHLPRTNWKDAWLPLGVALLLTILFGAPSLLPLRELRNWSSHGESLSFEAISDLSATPFSLFRLLLNGFFGGNSYMMWSLPSNPGEDAASLGLASFLLALLAPFLAPTSRATRWIYAGCILALVLSLGAATPLYHALYDHLFLFQIVRVPARWLELWAFGAALLGGFAFNGLLENPARGKMLGRVWLIASASCGLLLAFVFATRSPWNFGAHMVSFALDLPRDKESEIAAALQSEALLSCILAGGTLGLLAFLWRRGGKGQHWGLAVLALLLTEPLLQFWLSTRISPRENVQSLHIPATILVQHQKGQRWIVQAPFQQLNAPLLAGIDAVNGYEPFGSAPFFALASAAQGPTEFAADFQPQKMSPLWRVTGTSYLLWKAKFKEDRPRDFAGHTLASAEEWHLNFLEDGLQPWPRYYVTRQITRVDGDSAFYALRRLSEQPFIGAPGAIAPRAFPTLHNGSFSELDRVFQSVATPDLHTFTLSNSRDALFVENETIAPGWKAFVDDKPAPIYPANAIFRGVYLPAGARRLSLVYDSQTLRFSLFLALCGLAFAAAIGATRPKKTARKPLSNV